MEPLKDCEQENGIKEAEEAVELVGVWGAVDDRVDGRS